MTKAIHVHVAPQETAAPRTQQGVRSVETGHECTGCDSCKLVRPKPLPDKKSYFLKLHLVTNDGCWQRRSGAERDERRDH